MYGIREKSPYAGLTVKTKATVGPDPMTKTALGSKDFVIEDWWQNVSGKPWTSCFGNLAVMVYAFRAGFNSIPPDNEVLYGKIGMLGYLFHVSELELPEVS